MRIYSSKFVEMILNKTKDPYSFGDKCLNRKYILYNYFLTWLNLCIMIVFWILVCIGIYYATKLCIIKRRIRIRYSRIPGIYPYQQHQEYQQHSQCINRNPPPSYNEINNTKTAINNTNVEVNNTNSAINDRLLYNGSSNLYDFDNNITNSNSINNN